MKRSELLDRFYRAGVEPSVPTCYSLPDMERIAEALGVPVEPDEPPLPDRVSIIRTTTSDPYEVAWRVLGESGPCLVVTARIGDAVQPRRLLEELVAAYNESRRPLLNRQEIRTAFFEEKP